MNNSAKTKDLVNLIKEYQSYWKKVDRFQRQHFGEQESQQLLHFENVKLSDIELEDAVFESCRFINCSFKYVKFERCKFNECEFIDCDFKYSEIVFSAFFNVLFKDVEFYSGMIGEVFFADTAFDNIEFNKCEELMEIRFLGSSFNNTRFYKSHCATLFFEHRFEEENRQLSFVECTISNNTFHLFNLDSTRFEKSTIILCSFTNCQLSPTTFLQDNTTRETEFSLIDFQTILKSEIPGPILAKHFGIHSPDLKYYVMEMVSKVELHTVFISYSFSDKDFAHRLNDALKARGVFTFLWEKDATAGKRLKKIMSSNVNKFDKVLFIASQHSLKSEACHFELTNGRKKQDKNWDLVLFPIHIDSFLFTVEEDDIPRKNRAEFWTNIEELREINSMDFSAFAGKKSDPSAFYLEVDRLIGGLRKERKIK